MLTIVGIGGMPATGKTTLARRVLARLGPCRRFTHATLKGTVHAAGVTVLGTYDGRTTYGGTDQLSMAVQPHVLDWLQIQPLGRVFFEGDRLFNASFWDTLFKQQDAGFPVNPIPVLLLVDPETRTERAQQRANDQGVTPHSDAWLKGRATKYKRLRKTLGGRATYISMQTDRDLDLATDRILDLLELNKSPTAQPHG